ncbi:hypothetical protein [Thioclava marina]|uniref:hypothetical protein n=1 Tax=Thioclava marina TaxID=1915077 RepID=UPI0011BA7375|nr:hypothetical protein [Thioclava marina]
MAETQDIFPASEGDGFEPYREIARFAECDEEDVYYALIGIEPPEWSNRQHRRLVGDHVKALNRAVKSASDLLYALRQLPPDETQSLVRSGAATVPQIEKLLAELQGGETFYNEWHGRRSASGGREPAAYEIAEGVRRLFRRLKRKITFGQQYDGSPSGAFCRTVEVAIAAFGVRASWRGPAEEAVNKTREIERRHIRLVENAASKLPGDDITPDPCLVIEFEGDNVCLKLSDFPEKPPLKLRQKHFASGKEIKKFAEKWSSTTRAYMSHTESN